MQTNSIISAIFNTIIVAIFNTIIEAISPEYIYIRLYIYYLIK